MSASEQPLIYLILGAAGSGRREVLADLIEAGLGEDDHAAVLLADAEVADEFDARLPLGPRWTWEGGEAPLAAVVPDEATHVFFVTDGRRNPVDQIEAFKGWLTAHNRTLARAICVVNCQLGEKHPALFAWYEACIHFADVVFLNRREGVENKWLSDFRTHFKKQYFPAVFEPVKAGKVHNPAAILEPEARRISHLFDEDQDWVFTNSEGEEIDEEEETDDEDEEIEAAPAEDPYLARKLGGRRVKEIPDIAKYLSGQDS
jgi:hypothetical protein